MSVNIEFWQLIGFVGLLIAWSIAIIIGGGKMLVSQFEHRLDERFASQEEMRKKAQAHWDERFSDIDDSVNKETKDRQRLEREFLNLKADLPLHYVRRDDYIRNQTVIESKLDGLAVRIEGMFLKGDKHG